MTRFCILAQLLLTLSTPVMAAELKVGEALPLLTFEDQNGKLHTLDGTLRFLVFAPGRAGSQIVTAAFAGQTAATLQGRGIAYVADISGMPSLVASMFALPKMRKQPYPVLLGRKAADTAALPREGNRVTVIGLQNGSVVSIVHVDTLAGLRKALELDVKASGSPQSFPLAALKSWEKSRIAQ